MSRFGRLVQFLKECRRVLIVLRRPSRAEFLTVSKVSGIGLAILGFIGFAINLIKQLFF